MLKKMFQLMVVVGALLVVTPAREVRADGGPIPMCRPDCETMNPVPRCCRKQGGPVRDPRPVFTGLVERL